MQKEQNKMQMWLKGKCFSGQSMLTVLYCTAWLCSVTCYFIPFYFVSHSWFFFFFWKWGASSCVRVSVCVWGPEMKPTATASSDLMQKAARSSHHSLFSLVCLVSSSLQWLWSLLSLSAHAWLEIMMGAGGLSGCRNVTCIVGLLLDVL